MPDSWLANSFNAAQQDRKKSDVQAANGRKTRRQCQDPRLRHRTGICTRRSTTEALVVVAIALFCLDNYTSTTRNAHALMARPCQGRAQVTTTSSRMSFSAGERVALAARRAGTHPTDGDDDNPVEDLVVAALKRPVLAQITPDGVCSSDASAAQLLHSVEKAVAGGVTLVQLRDYKSDLESKVNLAKHLRHVTVGSPSLFVINLADGDASWARTAGADGVHLPERNIGLLTSLRDSSASVRPVWPLVAGCSVHSVHAALEAASLGADYVQVSVEGRIGLTRKIHVRRDFCALVVDVDCAAARKRFRR